VVTTSRLIDYQFSRAIVVTLALTTLVLVGTIDYATGYQVSFSVFYLLPVGFAAWYGSRSLGYAFAVASSLTWYAAEFAGGYPYDHPAIPVWNALVRLAFFVIIASLLAALNRRLLTEKSLARTDPLTGLVNARIFREQLAHDIALSGRIGAALTVVFVDLDDFKRVNDTLGHAAGDALLIDLARAMVTSTRRSDTVARLGGDEFALILPGTDIEGARSVMQKLAEQMSASVHEQFGGVTFSIGAVVVDVPRVAPADVIEAADRLMYIAKKSGKNAVAIGRYSDAANEDLRLLKPTAKTGDAA